MRKILLFTFLIFSSLNAQIKENSLNEKILAWGDYYFFNKKYEKAISFYLDYEGELPDKNIRNLARAYFEIGRVDDAEKSLKPIVDSDFAEVIDYYHYTNYITNNQSLKDEYIEKALKLPIKNKMDSNENSSEDLAKDQYALNNLEINTENSEFGAYYLNHPSSPGMIFSKVQPDEYNKAFKKRFRSLYPVYNLHKSDFDEKSFKVNSSAAFPNSINSLFQEGPASWDEKSDILYFTRSSKAIGEKNIIELDIYSIKYSDINSTIAFPIAINLQGYSSMHPSVSATDNKLYFASDRPEGFGGMDIYSSDILPDGKFGPVINLGPDINTAKDEVFPFIFNERFLFYSSTEGDGDVLNVVGDKFGNTETSIEEGEREKLDIKMAINVIENRWEIHSLNSPFNSPNNDDFSIYISNSLQFGLLASNRSDGKGDDDLYAFKFTPKIVGEDDTYKYKTNDTLAISFEGVLLNDIKKMFLNDPLTALFEKGVKIIKSTDFGYLKLNNNGSFIYKNNNPLEKADKFTYVINSDFGSSDPITVTLEREDMPKLKPLLPIFFDFDKFTLLEKYKDRLDAVVKTLNSYPEIKIEVNSYADCRGSNEYNLKLSIKRNESVLNYINQRIEKSERVFGEGLGEENIESLSIKNECPCCSITEEVHQKNRRTEFKIIYN
tara:strand:- start:15 stop:2009 length:1995 start_codon:yes stop_codon:yes gene_type:complete